MRKSKPGFTLAAALLAAITTTSVAQEAKLLAVLRSGASQEKKAAACRELARVATKEAVPALTPLLGDEKLSHMARYALETIADPSVDDALRQAMGTLKGRPLLGVIGSLGVRRDAMAVDAMARLLANPDAEIAQAAARALGKIGTPEAAQAIEGALAGATAPSWSISANGLFRCAEAMSADGQSARAIAIYDRLRSVPQAPHQVCAGALRGAILARGKEGIPLMVEALRGKDYVLVAAAARTAMELPGPEVTAALVAELPEHPAGKQILLISTLGCRGDASAGPALLALASKGPDAVRLAAIRNLTHLGYAPALALLAELSVGGNAELATAARTCLSNFPGKDAEAAIQGMLAHKNAKVRSLAVEMIGQRSSAGSAASLLKAVGDKDATVRIAALRALRDQAGPSELPALLMLLLHARSSAELQAAEGTIGALCARQSEPAAGNVVIVKAEYGKLPEGPLADVTNQAAAMVKAGSLAIEASNGNFGDPAKGISKKLRVDYKVNGTPASKTVGEGETLLVSASSTPSAITHAIVAAMDAAKGESKLALVRLLRSAGGPLALRSVAAAACDTDAQVKDAAQRVLCEWLTPDALPLLAGLVKTPPSETIKILALRGFVRLAPQQDGSDVKKLDSLKEAMARADRAEEKRLVLSALGSIPTVEALTLVMSHLDDAELKEEASLAAVAIAERIASSHGSEVAAAMQRVSKATANGKLSERATAIARQAKK